MAIFDEFIGTVKSGGLTNPYGLAAVAATGKHESGWSPKNVFGSWDDPSESGQSGTSGGALSWRGPRYEAMLAHARQDGDPTPTPREQADYFLRENPQLIRQLQNAKSPEEATRLMNAAWRFAGWNRPGGEAARRMATAREMAVQFQGVPAQPEAYRGHPLLGAAVPENAAPAPAPVQNAGFSGALKFYNEGQDRLDDRFQSILQTASAQIGRPLGITSGYRDPKYNAKVGGAKNSFHTHGNAADIDMSGMSESERQNLVRTLRAQGVTGFITYSNSPNMMHVDMRPGPVHYMHDRSARNMDKAPDWFKSLTSEKADASPMLAMSQQGRSSPALDATNSAFTPGATQPMPRMRPADIPNTGEVAAMPQAATSERNYLPAWMREDASLPVDPQTGASYFDPAPGGLGGLGGMRPGVSRGATGGGSGGGQGGSGLTGRIDAFVNANAPVGFGGIVGNAMKANRGKAAIRQQVEAAVRAYMGAGLSEDEAFLLATNPQAGQFVYGIGKERAEQQATQDWLSGAPGSAPAAPPAPAPSGYAPVPSGSVEEGPDLEAPGQMEEMPADSLSGPRPDGPAAPGRESLVADARGRLGAELREQQADGVNRLDPANAVQPPPANMETMGTSQQPVQLSQIEARQEQGSGNQVPTVQIETGNRTVDALMRKRAELVNWLASAPLNETASKLVERQKLQLEQIDKGLDKYDPTGAMREYQFAMQQRQDMGQPPVTFDQWENDRRRAGATNVTVGSERGYDKAIGEGYAKRFLEMQGTADSARSALNSLDVMEGAISDPGFYSGAGADELLQLKRWGRALGLDPEGIDSMEAFNSRAKAAALESMGGSLGSGFSNADRDFVTDQVPGLQNTPEGNKRLIEIQRKLNRRKLQIAEFAGQYAEQNGGRIDYQFDAELGRWAEANPLFTEGDKAMGGGRRRTKTGVEWGME